MGYPLWRFAQEFLAGGEKMSSSSNIRQKNDSLGDSRKIPHKKTLSLLLTREAEMGAG